MILNRLQSSSRSRLFIYLTLALFILMASWEANRGAAVFAAGEIPQEAIRLRILANSDSASDQWIKYKIRDAIVEQMNGWVTGPQTLDEARETIRGHLPELKALADDLLEKYGYDYEASVELGVVPFPTKMYGEQVYPAGDYEALRVSLGNAEGQNWWCVLFPPLCFVDAVTNEAVAKDDKKKDTAAGENDATPAAAAAPEAKPAGAKPVALGKAGDGKASVKETSVKSEKAGKPAALGTANAAKAAVDGEGVTAAEKQAEGETEYKFFLWEMLKKLFSLFK
ncbi:stage II sporulation protein R [Paenibacillus chartarius]|uniref:Stage II sporulation protein R n=1 Tax=Paenibacillus chartarius TaxID=747481 RepID=A0ABV6DUS5_9BACL